MSEISRESAVVDDAPDNSRYELHVDDSAEGSVLAGVEEYSRDGDVVSFLHTEIYPRFEGHGLASVLVRAALDDLRARGLHLNAVCSYVVAFIAKHPEYQDLQA